jgi:hypothetical protein
MKYVANVSKTLDGFYKSYYTTEVGEKRWVYWERINISYVYLNSLGFTQRCFEKAFRRE